MAQGTDAAPSSDPNQSYSEEAKKQLSWLKGVDAVRDSAQAVSVKDYRLWAYPGRGANVPGVDLGSEGQSLAELKHLCGLRYIRGVGDIVFSDEHMVLLKEAYDYAENYNRVMLAYCQNR